MQLVKATEIEGTGLCGYASATYRQLVTALGQPHSTDLDGKVQAEWAFQFNGSTVTVYDWKCTTAPQNVTWWNVGGTDPIAARNFVTACGFKFTSAN
jgi:hypothetical protein